MVIHWDSNGIRSNSSGLMPIQVRAMECISSSFLFEISS